MGSPTQRSLAYLKKQGYLASVVERWNPYARVRVDLFGFIDIVAIDPHKGFIAVQTTSTGNINARIKKILAIGEAYWWLKSGGRILVHGWSKKGKAGKRKLWELKCIEIILSDFPTENIIL
jgi:hypothetical protein